MDLIEKVSKGLECCKYPTKTRCDECLYNKESGYFNKCTAEIASDALEIVRELTRENESLGKDLTDSCERVRRLRNLKTAEWTEQGWCSNCKCDLPAYLIDWKLKACKTKYCPNCGARMKNGTN